MKPRLTIFLLFLPCTSIAEGINRTGARTLNDLIKHMPALNFNHDGNLIPFSTIEKIEILKDSRYAANSTDVVAGVDDNTSLAFQRVATIYKVLHPGSYTAAFRICPGTTISALTA